MQNSLPVKFQGPSSSMRIDMKHSYFSNYFTVEIIFEKFVVCQKISS